MNPDRVFVALLLSASLLALAGCGTFEKDKRAKAMDSALSTYGEAIRWGHFDAAYGLVHPTRRKALPKHLDNVRVTGYEVVQAPLMKDETSAEQVVRIEYVLEDMQLVRSLSDRQLWRYDKAAKSWWLYSGIPDFE